MSVFLNRFTRVAVSAEASLFAGHPPVTYVNLNRLVTGNASVLPDACDDCPRDQSESKVTGSRFGFRLLLFILLLLGVSTANAGLFCSDAPFGVGPDNDGDGKPDYGIVDGAVDYSLIIPGFVFPTQITIDTECTFQNFPASNPLTATLNFQTNDPSVYLITFNNVVFTGNMACANIDHRIWFVNGSDYGSKQNCQDLFIPVEAINKQNPVGKTTVGIGEQFTYTLTIPVLFDPVTQTYINNAGSANDLHSLTITDDLNATGANLTLVGTPTVVWDDGSATPVAHTFTEVGGLLTFVIDPGIIIPAGDQILIDITVVADNTNAVGTPIINTAKWSFGRLIEIDGVPTFFDPLPGENGVTQPLTIGAPDLVVSKVSADTALSLGAVATFNIDVQNIGGADAWGATILDLLPDFPASAGMCDVDPSLTVAAEIFAADGTTTVSGPLSLGVDYSVAFDGVACEFSLTMLSDTAVIGPTERLIITYDSSLDIDTVDDAVVLTNIAGATEYFSADPTGGTAFSTITNVLSTGTPGVPDFEDSHDVTTVLSGYLYQKLVVNSTSGEAPATTAVPGDTLRYRLRLFNFDEVIDDVTFSDILDPTLFNLASFNMLTALPDVANNVDFSFDGVTGLLQIFGLVPPLNVAPPQEVIIEFEIDVAVGLTNGTVVPNQARIVSTAVPAIDDFSDDPFLNGVYIPGGAGTPDSTNVIIQTPGPLSKINPAVTEYTIGEQFTYQITVPATTIATPLNDVRILDNLAASGADLVFVSAIDTGGTWTITNTGTASSPILEDTGTGIDIPANGQAIIDVTVVMNNSLTNQEGVLFDNSASYTYNRNNGDAGTQTTGGSDNTGNMTVVEPDIIAIAKVVDNATPTADEVVRYTVTLTANGSATSSDVFDVALLDSLALGLVYEGNPTVSVGAGVSAGNFIGAPDITGDGITTAQTLLWSIGSDEVSDIDIEAGSVITIAYDVRVHSSVLADQVLNNSAVAAWTSRDGLAAIERTGANGIGGLNDYVTAPVTAIITIPDIVATIDKQRTNDTSPVLNVPEDVRIGDVVEYTLTIPVPEGTLVNLQIEDVLPRGLAFESVVSINGDAGPDPFADALPFSYADIPASNITTNIDGVTGETTVTWNLGNINNQPLDSTPNDFVIVYLARVLNDELAQANNTDLINNVIIRYDTAVGTVTTLPVAETISVLQPDLSVSKSVATVDGDSVIVSSEIITYTVEIINNGSAPAYDTLFQDTIPDGLRQGISINVTSITLLNNSDDTLASDPVDFITSYDSLTGVAVWDFNAAAYTIPAGQKLHIEYQAQADAVLAEGLTMTNVAQVQEYYSTDTAIPPTLGGVTGIPQQYTTDADDTDSTTVYSAALPAKTLTSAANAAIGDLVTYDIAVPAVANASSIFDVGITDVLNTNLEFVSATIAGGISRI